jgi:integrase/recombinase XerC
MTGYSPVQHKKTGAEAPVQHRRSELPCTPTVTPGSLALAALIRVEAMKDKSYRVSPVGGEVGRYMRALRWSDKAQNTLDSYETVLSRLALDFAHYQSLDEFTIETLREFLDQHWGESAAATRANRLAAVRSFFTWAVEEGRATTNPADTIKPPKVRNRERHAYKPDLIHALIHAQPLLRDRIALTLLGRLGLRRNELRLLRLHDFDLHEGTVLVHGKGGKQVILPLGFAHLKSDLEVFLIARNLDEYLLFARNRTEEPMDGSSVHRWFKRCLERAGLPAKIEMHELRHSAAHNLWRRSGNLLLVQQLLRHESSVTTQRYVHPNRDDLSAALERLDELLP